jgi:adenine phosphoribosyltransferase
VDETADLKRRICEAFRFHGEGYADPAGWWGEPSLLGDISAALAALHEEANPTVIAGVEATGFILGTAVALSLGIGFVEVRKDGRRPLQPWEDVLRATTPPDYNQRDLVLLLNRNHIAPGARVLLVDEWMRTGAQAIAARDLVEQAGATWVGVSVIVADTSAEVRRRLSVQSLIRKHELPWW